MRPHLSSPAEVLAFYSVSAEHGLTGAQVSEHTRRFGLNVLTSKPPKSLWSKIVEQFEDYLVQILLGSAFVSFLLAVLGGSFESEGMGALVEPVVILSILVANAIIAIAQESNSEKALEELTKLQPVTASVRRAGVWQDVNAEDIVPGDVITLRVGDKAPADCRVLSLKGSSLKLEQASLTGENVSVEKDESVVADSADQSVSGQTNMIFSSTTVVHGSCIALVTATGMKTEIGRIHNAVEEAEDDQEKTPLGLKLDEFGRILAKVIAIICIVVWIINFNHFFDPVHGGWLNGCIYYFKIAVSLAVAAIPEGLLGVITTCLALGTRKMTKRNAIIRHLPSVETLGCTTVICSDKTGTLTTNEMCVQEVCLFGDSDEVAYTQMRVEGKGFDISGHCYSENSLEVPVDAITNQDVGLQWLSRVCSLCNEAAVEKDSSGKFSVKGEPTEAALLVLIEKLGCPDSQINAKHYQSKDTTRPTDVYKQYWSKDWSKILTLEFDRERKSMGQLIRNNNNDEDFLVVKGAPESILKRSTKIMSRRGTVRNLSSKDVQDIENWVLASGSKGLRTMALAMKNDCGPLKGYDDSKRDLAKATSPLSLEQEMTLVGLVAMRDPPRVEVPLAIQKCKEAGIKVHMITGDHSHTAEAVARDIGILPAKGNVRHLSYSGFNFVNLDHETQLNILAESQGLVFSRMEPRHKQVIIKRLRELNEVTAMTGDGVNDAPALKNADIGIAMGISGSAVAKESSDMILADDNFFTIVAAIEEGRSIYNNMKAFIRYLISSNIGEVASIFITAALGVPEGLTPVQLLWVNLVTDGPPATALGFNPPDVDVMTQKPRRKDEPLISSWVFFRYMVIGTYVGFATVGIFIWWYCFDTLGGQTLVPVSDLLSYNKCSTWTDFDPVHVVGMSPNSPCSYFIGGKLKASTLSLSVLVLIEMLNALNAISENHSLFSLPPWHNMWLILAIVCSIALHFVILYVPSLSSLFGVVPLSARDWLIVFYFSVPVIFIDELLKIVTRYLSSKNNAEIAKKFFLPKSEKAQA